MGRARLLLETTYGGWWGLKKKKDNDGASFFLIFLYGWHTKVIPFRVLGSCNLFHSCGNNDCSE